MWLPSLDKGSIHPGLIQVMELTFKKLDEWGVPFKAYSGLRTWEEQDRLYAMGRTAKGGIVTKARGGQSMHNYGLALDQAPLNLMTKDPSDVYWPNPDKSMEDWYLLEKAVFEAAQELGADPDGEGHGAEFEWGGRWRFRDVPHIQVRTTLRELRAGYYPPCHDLEWLVKAHTTFLFDTPWIKRRMQRILNDNGYDAGPVDGVFGSRTVDAISECCKDNGYEFSDRPDQLLVENLVRMDYVWAGAV